MNKLSTFENGKSEMEVSNVEGTINNAEVMIEKIESEFQIRVEIHR